MNNKEWKLREEEWDYKNERVRVAWRRGMIDKLIDLYEKYTYGKRTGDVDIGYIGWDTKKDGSVFYYVAMGYYSDLVDVVILNATNYIDALREVMIMWGYLPGKKMTHEYGYYDYGDIRDIIEAYAKGIKLFDSDDLDEYLEKYHNIKRPIEEEE